MKPEQMIKLLKPATKFKVAGKYARNAIESIQEGNLMFARLDCIDGHFVSGHDGDKSFLPVINALDELFTH